MGGAELGEYQAELRDIRRHLEQGRLVLFLGHDLGDPAVSALFDELADRESQIPSFAVWSGLSQGEKDFFESKRNLAVLETDPVALLEVLVRSPG